MFFTVDDVLRRVLVFTILFLGIVVFNGFRGRIGTLGCLLLGFVCSFVAISYLLLSIASVVCKNERSKDPWIIYFHKTLLTGIAAVCFFLIYGFLVGWF